MVDISIPLLDGIEAVRQIKKLYNQIKVIFLAMDTNVTYAIRAFEVGASGYVLKQLASSELHTAIHEVIKGRTYVTPIFAGELVRSYKDRSHQLDKDQQLTPRQRKILQLLVEGNSVIEVANLLNISRRTVEFHKYTLMSKLKLKTNSGLVKYAIPDMKDSGGSLRFESYW